MHIFGVTASLMSLGAIDFGLIVDRSVIMVENCMHRLSHADPGRSRSEVIRDAAIEVRKPTMFGELIIAVVYVPILLLQGSEGKLFRPMALDGLFRPIWVAGAVNNLHACLGFAGPSQGTIWQGVHHHSRSEAGVSAAGISAIDWPMITAAAALVIFGLSIPVAARLGAEFMPRLDEGDLLIEATRLPSASLEGALDMSRQIEAIVGAFPEVKTVFSKTGRPEIANDVMGVHTKPTYGSCCMTADQWPGEARDELIAEISES